jgi:hypothetical protein
MNYFDIIPNDVLYIILSKLNHQDTKNILICVSSQIYYEKLLYITFKPKFIKKIIKNNNYEILYFDLLKICNDSGYNYIKNYYNINKQLLYNSLKDDTNMEDLKLFITKEILKDIYKDDIMKCKQLGYKKSGSYTIFLYILYLIIDTENIDLGINIDENNIDLKKIYQQHLSTIISKLRNINMFNKMDPFGSIFVIIIQILFVFYSRLKGVDTVEAKLKIESVCKI